MTNARLSSGYRALAAATTKFMRLRDTYRHEVTRGHTTVNCKRSRYQRNRT